MRDGDVPPFDPPASSAETVRLRRRAELRGREAVARWRIQSAVWGGRLFATLFAVVSVFPLVYSGVPQWRSAAILLTLALAVLVLSEWLRRGSRVAAVLLLSAVVGAKLRSLLFAHEALTYGGVWTVILLVATANGVWGAFALAAARRELMQLSPAE